MTVVRREPPTQRSIYSVAVWEAWTAEWHAQGVDYLASGKHAVGCECEPNCDTDMEGNPIDGGRSVNACLTIAKALRDFAPYEIEEP